jgi:hypothetical protein
MKKSIIVLLVFLIIGLSYSGESPLPVIKDGTYDIEYRKGKTIFVDFVYDVKIQGKGKTYNGWLQVILYDMEGDEIESFGQEVIIKPKELQEFYGTRMMLSKVVNEIDEVVFDLGIYQKKY